MIAWLHPILGGLVVAAMLVTAFLGLRMRQRGGETRGARKVHGWLGPVAAVGILLAAISGGLTVRFLRDDMALAETTHFYVGWGAVALAVLAGLTAFLRRRARWIRAIHPWIGLLLAALCIVATLLGLEHLP